MCIFNRVSATRALTLAMLVGLVACDEAPVELGQDGEDDALGLLVLQHEDGHTEYIASGIEAARELLERVDAGELEVAPMTVDHLREHLQIASDDVGPRNLALCPSSNATTQVYRQILSLLGPHYTARAEWKKIGFGPHRPVTAQVTVCSSTQAIGCFGDSKFGTPLNVSITQMLGGPNVGSVSASAMILDSKNGSPCIASSAFQIWH